MAHCKLKKIEDVGGGALGVDCAWRLRTAHNSWGHKRLVAYMEGMWWVDPYKGMVPLGSGTLQGGRGPRWTCSMVIGPGMEMTMVALLGSVRQRRNVVTREADIRMRNRYFHYIGNITAGSVSERACCSFFTTSSRIHPAVMLFYHCQFKDSPNSDSRSLQLLLTMCMVLTQSVPTSRPCHNKPSSRHPCHC